MKNKEKNLVRIQHLKWFLKSRWTFFSLLMVYDVWPKVRHPLWAVYESKWGSKVRLWWSSLWIRKNEFHRSLDLDGIAMWKMNPKERGVYLDKLYKRRQMAHDADLCR
jgi:hypothetical protein